MTGILRAAGTPIAKTPGPTGGTPGGGIAKIHGQWGLPATGIGTEIGHRGGNRWCRRRRRRGRNRNCLAGAVGPCRITHCQGSGIGTRRIVSMAGILRTAGTAVAKIPGPTSRASCRVIGKIDWQRRLTIGRIGAETGHRGGKPNW
jgi:hypothetical protein